MTLISDEMLGDGTGHKSASKRREIELRCRIAEQEMSIKFRDSLICLLLKDRDGSATFPVKSLTDGLDQKPDSSFNDDKSEITFTTTPKTPLLIIPESSSKHN